MQLQPAMKHSIHLTIFFLFLAVLTVGCTATDKEKDKSMGNSYKSMDTRYTRQKAMEIYGYQPKRALQIIDSAVIVGNISQLQADQCRARIYGMSLMDEQLDSLLGGPTGIRLDSALAIGERVLKHDSVKNSLERQKDVLEVMSCAERMKNDTMGWLQRSRELIDVCRQIGADAETDALRAEAEIGAALCTMGQQEQGMAKLDSVIDLLNSNLTVNKEEYGFNELDALIIALRRKIMLLASQHQYAETLPLSRHIIEWLDDYEQNPGIYHDGSHREPTNDQKRVNYIRFYRNKAQNYIAAAYASLGENNNMLESFNQIEASVHDAMTREQIALYNALQQQMEVERQQAIIAKANMTVAIIGILALLLLAFAVVVIFINRSVRRKNRLLALKIADAIKYKKMYWEEKKAQAPSVAPDVDTATDEQLFQYINEVIVRERLYLDPRFERQTIMDRFQLTKERVGAIFSKGSDYPKLTNYIQQLRLDYAAKLLVEQPDKNIVQIAADSGFSSSTYFSNCFRQHFGLNPTDFRRNALSRRKEKIAI